jgi:eukaryotic-like serine/threonine-protein kinase
MNALTSAPPSAIAASLPRKLGRYTLFEHVGKGGMAEIYLARAETELGATRLAVVKRILPAYADDAHFSELLIHEAKLAARLSHKHIVQVFDLGRTGGTEDHLFIAMEYVEGFDLNALLRRCSEQKVGLPAPHALGIVLDVLHGLDYAHRRTDDEGRPLGIVHRDVSPSNVLISYEGEVKLCDFGIAHANDLVKERESEALKGKAGYMSPEHARGEAVDVRSDVFAAGIILWELLAGRRLYKPKTDLSLFEQARRAEIPPVPDKGLPRHDELAAIVGRALAVDREARYASAAQFARDLESYLADAGLLASRLELGKWMAESFGTELVEQRRASESRLPKSLPPTRPSERVATPSSGSSVTSAVVPAAPRLPSIDPASPDAADEMSLANTPEPSLPIHATGDPIPGRVTAEPGSLAGASMDVSRSSAAPVDPHATERPSAPELAPPRPRLALVMILLALAVLAAIVWNATR